MIIVGALTGRFRRFKIYLMGTRGLDREGKTKMAGRGVISRVKRVAKNNWQKTTSSCRCLNNGGTFTLTPPRWVGDGRRKVEVR